MKKWKKIVLGLMMAMIFAMPLAVYGGSVSYDSNLSTSNSKYYCRSYQLTEENIFKGELIRYTFRPEWRVNKNNSIYATTDSSTFLKKNVISPWKLVDSASDWSTLKIKKRTCEAYYGEAIAWGWGINLKGFCSAEAQVNGVSVKLQADASVTIGQALSYKYKATVETGKKWTSCSFSDRVY